MRVRQQESLSEYPSEAIRQSVKDIEYVERTPGLRIDMSTWSYVRQSSCSVCQAGAIAMRRYSWEPSTLLFDTPSFSPCTLLNLQISSFEYLRQGIFDCFIYEWIDCARDRRLILRRLETAFDKWTSYETNKSIYKKNLLKVANIFEEERY